MSVLPKKIAKHVKGQADHVDAWLMSYADLITLLFMFFIIFVSFTYQHSQSTSLARGEPEHPYIKKHSDTLTLNTPYEEAYRSVAGIIASNNADQVIGVEKTTRGFRIDISAPLFFESNSADIKKEGLPMLRSIAEALKDIPAGSMIEVAAYTDDQPVKNPAFANNWELSAMQAAHMVNLLVAEGIDPSRLHASSFASNRPLVPNQDVRGNPIAENRLRNQRLVIKVERPLGGESLTLSML